MAKIHLAILIGILSISFPAAGFARADGGDPNLTAPLTPQKFAELV
jgi:hypothetical protein